MAGAEEGAEPLPKPRHAEMYIGQHGPSIWRHGMEIANPLVDGLSKSEIRNYMVAQLNYIIVNDFAAIPPLIDHAIRDVMRCTPSDHPILVTEPTWNTPANRERMAEIMFEEFKVPAFYIANTGVLNAYVFFLVAAKRVKHGIIL
jgi:actin-like protein 6B